MHSDFEIQLYGAWRGLNLSAAPDLEGRLIFVCPRCPHPRPLLIEEREAKCVQCDWAAEGDPWGIAQEAALVSPVADGESPLFVDLGELLRQGLPRELPTLAEVSEDLFLLYAGRINEIHGEPSVGKTNVGCAFVAAIVRSGGSAMFLDPEDTPRGITAKLASFGLTSEQLSNQVLYVHDPTPEKYDAALDVAKKRKIDLVLCDGLAEALAAEGLNEDVPADVLGFFRKRLRPFADAGSAVMVSDHVVKNTETRGRWARGSGAKMGRYDGVSYELTLGESYSPGKAGFVRLIISKDRLGGIGVYHELVAELHFSPGEAGQTILRWAPPGAREDFVPTAIMAKICQHLQINPEAGMRDLRGLGKSQYVDVAIRKLEELGHLKIINQGAGKRVLFELLSPFLD